MKPCPICKSYNCLHIKKFFTFGLTKIVLIQKSLEKSLAVFAKLANFLPGDKEVQAKIRFALEDLHKVYSRINDVKTWYENQIIK